jgi:hypothetical protein
MATVLALPAFALLNTSGARPAAGSGVDEPPPPHPTSGTDKQMKSIVASVGFVLCMDNPRVVDRCAANLSSAFSMNGSRLRKALPCIRETTKSLCASLQPA